MIRKVASSVLGMSVVGWALACGGAEGPSQPGAPNPPATAPAPAPAGVPVLGVVVDTDAIAGAGCSCALPGSNDQVFVNDDRTNLIHIDGADRKLQRSSDETKGAGRVSKYSGDGYDVTLKWKLLEELEGGTSYDVKARVAKTGGGTLETQLTCGCSN